MNERPILMSAPMVRAILVDEKSQTRRIVKPSAARFIETLGVDGPPIFIHGPKCKDMCEYGCDDSLVIDGGGHVNASPYGAVHDRLWVRETHAQFSVGNRTGDAPQCVAYRATCDEDGSFDYVNNGDEIMNLRVTKWTPAIFMPRWASRITLEITGLRVERLQTITENDAKAEGVEPFFTRFPSMHRDQRICDGEYARDAEHRASFACLWDEINGDRALWSSNPFVWVVEFTRFPPEAA